MKKLLLLLFLITFVTPNLSAQERWDISSKVYVNYDYQFTWKLDSELDWYRIPTTSKETVFKAKCKNIPVIVFVMPNEYNPAFENKDIWTMVPQIRNSVNLSNQKLLELGVKTIQKSLKKVSFHGMHAIEVISQADETNKESTTLSDTKISTLIIHNGRLYSICILTPTEIYSLSKKEAFDMRYFYNGFSFIKDDNTEKTQNKVNIGRSQANNLSNGYNLTEKDRNDFRKGMIKLCEQFNQQLPCKVDELTTLYSTIFLNNTLKLSYKVDLSVDDYSYEEKVSIRELLLSEVIKSFKTMFANHKNQPFKSMYDMMKAYNMKIYLNYRDVDNVLFTELTLTCEDFK